MAQFHVYRNLNSASNAAVPYLLDLQSSLIDSLPTRIVAPLTPVDILRGKTMRKLMPTLEVDGEAYVMDTPQLAGAPTRMIGPLVADLSGQRAEIMAAIDLLFLGY